MKNTSKAFININIDNIHILLKSKVIPFNIIYLTWVGMN